MYKQVSMYCFWYIIKSHPEMYLFWKLLDDVSTLHADTTSYYVRDSNVCGFWYMWGTQSECMGTMEWFFFFALRIWSRKLGNGRSMWKPTVVWWRNLRSPGQNWRRCYGSLRRAWKRRGIQRNSFGNTLWVCSVYIDLCKLNLRQ